MGEQSDKLLTLGAGGAGMAMARLAGRHLRCSAAAVNTDAAALRQSGMEQQVCIFMPEQHALPTPADVAMAMPGFSHELRALFDGVDKVLVTVGLGGATGTGATASIVDVALAMGIHVATAVTLPFAFETERREAALRALPGLRKRSCELLVIDNEQALRSRRQESSLAAYFDAQAVRIAEWAGSRFQEAAASC